MKRTLLVSIVFALVVEGASAQLQITDISVSSTGSCTIVWTHTVSYYIVAQRASLSNNWQYVGEVVSENRNSINNHSAASSFYGIREVQNLDSDFPDVGFANVIRNLGTSYKPTNHVWDIDCDVTLLRSSGANISNLTGIANFKRMSQLRCNGNKLASLDLSACTNLTYLVLCDNTGAMSNLNLTGYSTLLEVQVQHDGLTNIVLAGCTNLSQLYCDRNSLTSLVLPEGVAPEYVNCSANNLTGLLDISACTNLWYLDARNNPSLTEIKVPASWDIDNLPLNFYYDAGVWIYQ